MGIITKRAFAKRCRISMPTCYKWIEKNKDGLSAYVHEDGIDSAVFDTDAWKKYKSDQDIANESNETRIKDLEEEIAGLRSETDRLKDEYQKQIDHLQEIITMKNDLITELNKQIDIKDQQIKEIHIIMHQRSLPAPRRSLLEWLGIKKNPNTND